MPAVIPKQTSDSNEEWHGQTKSHLIEIMQKPTVYE